MAQATPEELGRRAGDRFFELSRRRLSSQAQGSKRDLARFFAGRGGGAGSAAAGASRQLQEGERASLADASLRSMLEGERVGRDIGSFREGVRQFNVSTAARAREAAANREHQRSLSLEQQRRDFLNQQQLLRLRAQLAKRKKKGGLFGRILKGVGAAGLTLLTGGAAAPALLAGGTAFLGGGGSSPASDTGVGSGGMDDPFGF